MSSEASLTFRYIGFGADAVDYDKAWQLQRALHQRRVADEIGDVVLMLEHSPVYTAGKRAQPRERPVDGAPVVEVDRGGKITWHGPGQLVGYPVARLPASVYVVDYVRRLEEALIRTCTDLGLATCRVPGRSGVWVPGDDITPDRKVAALGVRLAQGVTMHGLALNCDCTLTAFDAIVPCGISDAGVTTLSRELGRSVTVEDAAPVLERHLRDLLGWSPYTPSPALTRPPAAVAV